MERMNMGSYNQNWEEIGRNIQSLVDEAVRSQDYQKLNQAIRQTVSKAVDLGGTAVKKAVDTTARSASAAGTGISYQHSSRWWRR